MSEPHAIRVASRPPQRALRRRYPFPGVGKQRGQVQLHSSCTAAKASRLITGCQ